MIERIGAKWILTKPGLGKAMAKYKPYDYFRQVLVPVSLEDQLMPGTLEFAIHTLVETWMDTGVFDGRFRNDETGRKAYDICSSVYWPLFTVKPPFLP